MWIYLFSLLFCLFLITNTCTTPLGQTSKCVSLHQSTSDVNQDSSNDSVLPPSGQCGRDFTITKKIKDSYIFFFPPIFGGTEALVGEFPWLALLWYKPSFGNHQLQHHCGGMLITRRYVVTAAHCITGVEVQEFGDLVSVSLGEYDLRNKTICINGKCSLPPQNIPVLNAYAHEDYDGNVSPNDIGLIKLSKRVNYNEYVQPICLDRSRLWKEGDKVVIAGWGKTLEGPNSPVLRKVSLPIADQQSCRQQFKLHRNITLTESQLCVGGEFKKDACAGDSGGPAMRRNGTKWEAIAVISFGYGCGRDGWPGVYTVIADFYDWIIETMQKTARL